MKRIILASSVVLVLSALVFAQIKGEIKGHGEKPAIAIPDFRGAGDAQRFMDTFNSTLDRELNTSGQVTLRPKTT
jgi:TolB protein